jgi:hypothetical protein
MLTVDGCTVDKFEFGESFLARIPFGSEKQRWKMDPCGDCGVKKGRYHHPGCDIEECPRCGGQAISCGCADDGDDDRPVDVPMAIEILSGIIREGFDDPQPPDHVFIDPVRFCGHVGRGHVRDMERGEDLPLDEWFRLGRYMGSETEAILFMCRSVDLEHVGEADLNVARSIAAYADENAEAAWDLVYVTRSGNFKASDLLGLPGHPEFDPCNYRLGDKDLP